MKYCDATNLHQLRLLIEEDVYPPFSSLYVDPPWEYKNKKHYATPSYPTMSLTEIGDLPIPDLANKKSSRLYLWVTNPFLENGMDLLKSWGFKYKSSMVWDKIYGVPGYYWRGQHETLLLGVKGTRVTFSKETRFPSVLRQKRSRHSKKPDIVREQIYKQASGPCIELFAREVVENWVTWGNEISEEDFNKSVVLRLLKTDGALH